MHFHENKYSKNVILETLSTSGHSHIHSCRCISLQVCSLQRKYSHLAAAVATFILQKFVLYFVRWWRYLWKAVAPRNSFLMMLCYFEKNSQSFICHHVELSRTSSTTTSTSTSTLQQQLTSITQLLKHSSSTFFFWKYFSNCATHEFFFFFFFFFLSSIWLCLLIFVLVTIQCQILDQFDFKNKKSNFFAQIWFKVEGL